MTAKQHICGVMITMATYGTWLRGDARGWVEDGRQYPANPPLESHDRAVLKHEPYYFKREEFMIIGEALGRDLIKKLSQRILALCIQAWHVHFLVADSDAKVPDIVKCAKDAVRCSLRVDRPI